MYTEYLKYTFSEDELRDFAKELARQNTAANESEEEKKAVVAQFTEKLASAKSKISQLSRYINNGYEYRQIECEQLMHNPSQGMKTVVRKDTGEIVKTIPMTAGELQDALPFDKEAEEEAEETESAAD